MDRLATIINGIHGVCLVLMGIAAVIGAWMLVVQLQAM